LAATLPTQPSVTLLRYTIGVLPAVTHQIGVRGVCGARLNTLVDLYRALGLQAYR
jgi:hypothetical protein